MHFMAHGPVRARTHTHTHTHDVCGSSWPHDVVQQGLTCKGCMHMQQVRRAGNSMPSYSLSGMPSYSLSGMDPLTVGNKQDKLSCQG